MSDAVLSARGLRKNYRSGDRTIEVLRGVDLEVHRGESVSIRGESGSGKSTLLNLLAGLDAFEGGELHWDGEARIDAAHRARFLGMIFQSFYLIPELNARENVRMACRVAGSLGSEERKRAGDLLARVGLAEREHHLPSQLSGGERQRVAIARALVNQPKLILADEPTGNLDEKTADSVMDLMLGLCAETQTALVLVTHNPEYARRTSRETLLHLGRLENVRPPK